MRGIRPNLPGLGTGVTVCGWVMVAQQASCTCVLHQVHQVRQVRQAWPFTLPKEQDKAHEINSLSRLHNQEDSMATGKCGCRATEAGRMGCLCRSRYPRLSPFPGTQTVHTASG